MSEWRIRGRKIDQPSGKAYFFNIEEDYDDHEETLSAESIAIRFAPKVYPKGQIFVERLDARANWIAWLYDVEQPNNDPVVTQTFIS